MIIVDIIYRYDHTVCAPDSCVLCGVVWREHGWRSHGLHSQLGASHYYVQPDDRLRLARMKERRRVR